MPSRQFEDPYRLLSYVGDDHDRRKIVKAITLEIIGAGNPAKRRSGKIKEMVELDEYKAICANICENYPALLKMEEQGLDSNGLAYHESEIVLATIEKLHLQGIVTYPMHDAILVKAAHADQAAHELRQQFSNYVYQASGVPLLPSVTIQYADEPGEAIAGWST